MCPPDVRSSASSWATPQRAAPADAATRSTMWSSVVNLSRIAESIADSRRARLVPARARSTIVRSGEVTGTSSTRRQSVLVRIVVEWTRASSLSGNRLFRAPRTTVNSGLHVSKRSKPYNRAAAPWLTTVPAPRAQTPARIDCIHVRGEPLTRYTPCAIRSTIPRSARCLTRRCSGPGSCSRRTSPSCFAASFVIRVMSSSIDTSDQWAASHTARKVVDRVTVSTLGASRT